MPKWINAILAFWNTEDLIPRKMSSEFVRSSDGKNKMSFLEIALVLVFELLKLAEKDNAT